MAAIIQATFDVTVNYTENSAMRVKFITAYTDRQLARLIKENKTEANAYYIKVFDTRDGNITVYNKSKKNWIKS